MSFERTINFEKYLLFQGIKQNLEFDFYGVNIGKAIASDLIGICLSNSNPKLKDIVFWPFLKLETKKFRNAFNKADILLTSLYSNRQDHKELLDKLRESIPGSTSLNITPHRKSPYINIKAFLYSKKYILQNGNLKSLSLRSRLYLFSRAIYYCHQVYFLNKEFRGIDLHRKKYVPFISSVGVEAILTLFFKNKGADTFHIFHGIFGRYKLNIATDIINGDNITANHILALSESTRLDLIQDFNCSPEDIFVAGNPKYPLREISIRITFSRCIVLSGFEFYDEDFLGLLDLLNRISKITSIKFFVKPHPNSSISSRDEIKAYSELHFLEKNKTLKSIFTENVFDFAITFNTVTYYECMYYGLICLRYSVRENIDFEGLDDKFFDLDSFLEKINQIRRKGPRIVEDEISRLLITTIGMGINNYGSIINSFN